MPYGRELAIRLQALDRPGGRKQHHAVMPKCGGMAMAFGSCLPIVLWAPKTNFVNGLLLGGLIIVFFGIADDIKDLRPTTKLLGQVMAALVIVLVGGVTISDMGALWFENVALPYWAALPLTLFVVVGITNATNLSDGLDGLAGGLALLVFICIGYLAVGAQDWITAMIAIAVGGSVLGFLRFNSYPAQLFMGDAGSQLLGFVAGVLAVKLAQQSQTISPIIPLIILGIPVLDTLTVMIRRISRGRSPFSADRTHFHHQLIQTGLYHTEAVLTIYLVQAILIGVAIVFHDANDWTLLLFYLAFVAFILLTQRVARRTGYTINRDHFIRTFELRLMPLKDRGKIIKFSFGAVKLGLPTLLMFNTILQLPVDMMFFSISAGFMVLLFLAWWLDLDKLNKAAKMAFYLFVPFMVFKCDQYIGDVASTMAIIVINLFYLFLLVCVFLTAKLTRRANGFKSSTLDFLVIFVILLISNLPNVNLHGYMLGLVGVKTVILYYSYEVLVGELRRKSMDFKMIATVFVLICSMKGLIMFIS
jgi:UDP-GlcNAc:undecaprenyl-phosphate GlcNAc-1-phosphate transferase